jgi:ATP-dependent exoDNAse (exonuclease V) beta subunit
MGTIETDLGNIGEETKAKLTELGKLRPTLVRASAGTGKTYQLTSRLLRVLFQGSPVESILATTFTRKAAAEILQRLLIALANAADPDQPEHLANLRIQVQIPTLPRSACVQQLSRVMHSIHRLRVCTLDSFFSQLARSFPFELGLPPGWRLLDEIEASWTLSLAVDDLIDGLEPNEVSSLLSLLGKGEIKRSIAREVQMVVDLAYSLQRRASSDVWDQLIVPAGPESDELTRSAGELLTASVPQESLRKKLAKFAQHLQSRQPERLEHDTLLINYVHSKRTGRDFTYGRMKLPVELRPAFEVAYRAVRTQVLSLLKLQNVATGEILRKFDFFLTRLRLSDGAFAFDDVAIRLADAFDRLDATTLASRMDGTIDHVLLDEFQDTSPVQWAVLRYFALRSGRPAIGEAGQVDHSFFCVGDTKQAIYGWRGGVAEIFDSVTSEISGVEEVQQNESFRSSPVVLDFVTTVFTHLTRHRIATCPDDTDLAASETYEAKAVQDFAKGFPVHKANNHKMAGYVRMETATTRIDERQFSNEGEEFVPSAENVQYYQAIAQRIYEIHTQHPSCSLGVLTRTNDAVAQLIQALSSHPLNVSQEGGNPLTDSPLVEVVLSALMLSEHPGDLRWEYHVRHTPLVRLLDPSEQLSTEELASEVRRRIEHDGLAWTLSQFSKALIPAATAQDSVRLRQLMQLAVQFEQQPFNRIRDLVRLVREKRVDRPQIAPLRVMTVHQAKGLEFDAVILPELDAPLTRATGGCVVDCPKPGDPPRAISRYLSRKAWHFLPERWQTAFGRSVAAEVTEALCLLYVALTRARQALYLVIPPQSSQAYDKKTPASIIYHALEIQVPPTAVGTVLYEIGDALWSDRRTDERIELEQNTRLTNPRMHAQTMFEFAKPTDSS